MWHLVKGRLDEEILRLMCQSLGLECEYDLLHMQYIFRQKIDPNNIGQCIEYCFGEETELRVYVYDIRRMSLNYLYQRLTEVFGHA